MKFPKTIRKFFWKWKIEKIECTHIINTFPQQVVKDSSRFVQRRALQLVHIFIKNIFAIFFGGLILGWQQDGHSFAQNAWFWCPESMKILVSTLTSRSSNSMMPRSLRMFGHVFNVYSSRSRDLEGYYTGRVAERGRNKSVKVGCLTDPAMCPSLIILSLSP